MTRYTKRPSQSRKLDISAFINNAKAAAPEEQEQFVPKHTFADFQLAEPLARRLQERGYSHPTPIQDGIIPHILAGRDVVGLANTGTGKTAAFLIPLMQKLVGTNESAGQVLVLAPTRELALQIDQEFQSFAKYLGLRSVLCIGGEGMGMQMRKLRAHNHFIIGTPGRTIDLVRRGAFRPERVQTVVLDEADRMLDMGFIADIRFLLGRMPNRRHTLCFSATLPPAIAKLVGDFLREPTTVSVKTKETPETIHQDVVRVNNLNKMDILCDFLADKEFEKVLVFGRTRHGVERLCRQLSQRGVRADSIHSDKSQGQRQRALRGFKENRVQVLVATDIASRGLDIQGITHVINYELPATYEDYVHRIGRTGRGERLGRALTFVD